MARKIQSINWPAWAGLLLTAFAFLSYPFIFVRWPSTRDFPWANLILFGISAALLLFGIRRAFAGERPARSKIAASILTTVCGVTFAFFILAVFVAPRWMPAARGAPQVGQKAPGFSLSDTNGKTVLLAELLSSPINGKAPRGVLLIFYRGYW